MFTGLVQDLGRISSVERSADGVRLGVETRLAAELAEGDSVAVSGVCLTAVRIQAKTFSAEVVNETLERSSLRGLSEGATVNLELPLRAGDRLGGHVVQGHVDGVGNVVETAPDGFSRRVRVQAAPEVLRYVVHKGSVAVDGVSLTVSGLDDASFTVSLIPETLQRTSLGAAQPGARVNLEVDVLAKYVEKLVGAAGAKAAS
jgi:riboflavin synthase